MAVSILIILQLPEFDSSRLSEAYMHHWTKPSLP